MDKGWLIITFLSVAKMVSGDGSGIMTYTKSIGSDTEGTTWRNPVVMQKKLWGSYKGRIDIATNEGPIFNVEVLRYTKYNEGRKMDVTLTRGSESRTITLPCEKCGRIMIYNTSSRVVVRDLHNHVGVLARAGRPGVFVIARDGECVERKYLLKVGLPVDKKLSKFWCDTAINEIKYPERRTIIGFVKYLFSLLFGKVFGKKN